LYYCNKTTKITQEDAKYEWQDNMETLYFYNKTTTITQEDAKYEWQDNM